MPVRNNGRVITLLLLIYSPDVSITLVGPLAPYKIYKECYLSRSCLVDAGRTLFFVLSAGIPASGENWPREVQTHNAE